MHDTSLKLLRWAYNLLSRPLSGVYVISSKFGIRR